MANRIKIGGVEIDIRADGSLLLSDLTRAKSATAAFASGAQNNLQSVSKNVSTLTASIKQMGVAMLALGVGAGFVKSIKTLADFGQAMSTVKGVLSATTDQMGALEAKAKQLGANTRFTATQAAEGMIFLARAGFDANEVLTSIEGTLNLAQAGALDLGRAADIASNVLSGFNLETSETGRVVDVLAAAANAANTDVNQLGEALKFAAPTAVALGLGLEETVAIIGKLSDAGVQGGLAGRGFQSVATQFENQRKAITGIIGDYDIATEGLSTVVRRLTDAGISTKQIIDIFRAENLDVFTVLQNSSRIAGEGIESLNDKLDRAEGTAKRMAETMDQNLNGALLSAGSAFESLVLAIGEAGATEVLIGIFRGLADTLRSASSAVIDFVTRSIDAAEQAAAKWSEANAEILRDIPLLERAQEGLRDAIETQGDEAERTAQREVDAIARRIAKNRELAGEYARTAKAELIQAEDELSGIDEFSLRQNLLRSPQRDPQTGRTVIPYKELGFSEYTPGRASLERMTRETEERFGDLDQQMRSVNDLINETLLQKGVEGLSVYQRRSSDGIDDRANVSSRVDRLKETLELLTGGGVDEVDQVEKLETRIGKITADTQSTPEEKSKAASEALREYAKAVKDTDDALRRATALHETGLISDDDLYVLNKVFNPVKPKGPGGDDNDGKDTTYSRFTLPDEDLADAISEIAKAKDSDKEKSRGALAALIAYAKAVDDVSVAVERAQALFQSGVLSAADYDLFLNESVPLPTIEEDPFAMDEIDAAMEAQRVEALRDNERQMGFDPDRQPDEDEDYFEGFETDAKNATKRALYDAIITGDYGDLLGNALGDAAARGLSRAVDQMVDLLWDNLPDILNSIFSEVNWGDVFNAVTSAFGFLSGGKASGGDVSSGRAYRVGELGPELFVPSTDGYIIPNRSGAMVSSEGPKMGISIGGTTVIIDSMGRGVSLEELEERLSQERRAAVDLLDIRVREQQRRGAY